VKRIAVGGLALVATLWLTIYWVEAEKEIVVLCGLSRVGTTAAEVQRLHGTASLATLRADSAGPRVTTRIASARNLGMSACTVTVDDTVVAADYGQRMRLAPLIGLRRSLGVEDRVPGSALAVLAPQSLVGEIAVGALLLLTLGALVTVLGLASQRRRWAKAIPLVLIVNIGVILLIGS
jgi:hypothetical protein